jgi:hypothetical protein
LKFVPFCHAVVTHPRCANGHVDAKAIPMWTTAGESKPRVHGMNIHGGKSRIGAETTHCSTCHMTSTLPNDPAPGAVARWYRLAACPGGFHLVRQESAEICAQLKDPKRKEPAGGDLRLITPNQRSLEYGSRHPLPTESRLA